MKINIKGFALACGVFGAIAMFVMTWWLLLTDAVLMEFAWIGSIYLGYVISPMGSFIGAIWGFIDGLIAGALFAYLYNYFTDLI